MLASIELFGAVYLFIWCGNAINHTSFFSTTPACTYAYGDVWLHCYFTLLYLSATS